MTTVMSRTLVATARYEALMAARGRMLWWALTPLTLLAVLLALTSEQVVGNADPVRRVAETAIVFSLLCTVGVAVGLTDRLRIHRRSGLTDLLDATAARGSVRLVGSFLGSLAVALAVPLIGFCTLVVTIAIETGSASALVAGLVAAAVIILPASVVLASFATLLGVLMPAAFARAITVVAWIWATVLNPTILPVPTVTGTVLSPLGRYPAAAWLHAPQTGATYGLDGVLRPVVSGGTATLQVLVVLAVAALLLSITNIRLAARH
ncbi:hypothetical protein GCM10009676_13310 [Prauserella halophila]|uniref:ABC-2 type transport system permease protein n=1 Tax=Prauserella halophila TaxID=185641 RepID=A0ABN1W1T8_9PSEU|nr:hypothetical protein [Prauserella halophila]MCP2236452.1 ABC-2 type transport system permease protein [Prauserella halophila]